MSTWPRTTVLANVCFVTCCRRVCHSQQIWLRSGCVLDFLLTEKMIITAMMPISGTENERIRDNQTCSFSTSSQPNITKIDPPHPRKSNTSPNKKQLPTIKKYYPRWSRLSSESNWNFKIVLSYIYPNSHILHLSIFPHEQKNPPWPLSQC